MEQNLTPVERYKQKKTARKLPKNFQQRVMYTCTPHSDQELLKLLLRDLAEEYLQRRFKDRLHLEITDFDINYTFN